jgi:hypothetical protein
MKATFNLKAGGEVFPIKRVFLPVLGLFQNNRSLLTADEYEVRAQVPPSVVQTFVQIVQGAEPDLSEGTCKALRLLGEEFQFEALTAECAAFEALHQPACEATTETVTAALEKRVSHLEEQSLIMERGSELVEKTVRSLCDQLAFVDSEVRRLSEVCDGLMNKPGPPDTEDNLTSAASDRPLSANQGRILNEKIAVIAGYFESGSEKTAKLAQKPEPLRTISVDLSGFVRGSGRTSYDGSGSITIAIATQTPRTFDGEQAYRRGCECLYEANTFGPRGEEMARTLGLSLFKQSAELGNSDGQYRYGRCLLYGDGCEKDTISGVEYLKELAEQGNSWAEAEYGKCLLVPDRSGVARDIDRGI